MKFELTEQNTPLVGILCVFTAVLLFSTADMLLKMVSDSYPLHQIILFRAVVAITITVAVLVPLEGGFRGLLSKKAPLHLMRGLCVVIANMSFFYGVASMPLAEATAIFFFAPLAITALSVPFLGEKVGKHRWAAILAGLVGVLIIIRPGSDTFQTAALGPLIGALAYATMQILTRKIGLSDKASTMAFYIQLTFCVICITSGLTIGDGRYAEGLTDPSLYFVLRAWEWPTWFDALHMSFIGVVSAFGGYLVSQGYRIAQATTVAPFEYVMLPASFFWGIVIFGEYPDGITYLGSALIMAAGVYAFWREAVRGKAVAADRPMPRNAR